MSDNEIQKTAEKVVENMTAENTEEWTHRMDVRLKAALMVLIGLGGTLFIAWFLGRPLGDFMENVQNTIFYHLFPFILSMIFFGILVYRSYIQNVKGTSFLAAAVLLHGISEFFSMISNPTGGILFRGGNQLAMIGDLMFPLAIIMIYLHIELTDKIRPSLIHAIGIIGTAAPFIIGSVFFTIFVNTDITIIKNLVDEVQAILVVYLGLFAIVVLWIALFAFKVMYRTLEHADSPEIALSSSLLLVAFSSLLTDFILLPVTYTSEILEYLNLQNDVFTGFTIYNTWLITFALITIIMAYILTPRFSYSVPFDVYQLVCIQSEIGVTLFSFVNEIRSEKGSTHDALQSATIVAIQNLVQEIAAAEGNIVVIGLEDRIIVFRSKEELVTVLITERNSYFLDKGLEEFTEAFYDKFEKEITMFSGNVGMFKQANELVRIYLPFMRKESLV